MPFALFNVPTSFQDYINKMLTKKLDVFVIIYLAYIMIYTNELDHINSIQLVFE